MSKSKKVRFVILHLCTSFLIAVLISIWIFGFWYPSPLAKALGVMDIFLLMIIIDIIIGPILGFLIYKEGKNTLKFDLSIVILIQISALLLAVYSMFEGRPAWIVLNAQRFELIRQNDIVNEQVGKIKPEYKNSFLLSPKFVAVGQYQNLNLRNNDLFAEVETGVSNAQRPERYVPLNDEKDQIKKYAQNLDKLEAYNSNNKVKSVLEKYTTAQFWLPLRTNHIDMVVLLDKNTEVVKIVDLRPWK